MPLPDASFPRYSSVKTLLNGLFDYAGLFPPAALTFPDALDEYLAHRAEADDWMLGPFVMPVSRFEELEALADRIPDGSPLPLQLLPPPAATMERVTDTLTDGLREVEAFTERMKGRVTVAGFEWKLPADALVDAATAVTSLTRVESLFRESAFPDAPRYIEIIRGEDFAARVPLFFLALGAQSNPEGIRAKIRCGGMNEADFPSSAELATFLHAALRTGYPFKATAGLHHPVRHFNEAQQVMMHGFLNVFFAVTIGRANQLDAATIASILDDTDPGHFVFTGSGIAWNDWTATTTEFIRDRRTLCMSIGSCSFDEPREDLRRLGWLTH